MNNSDFKGRHVKPEMQRASSPTFSIATTVVRPGKGRQPSPTPSCSSERGQLITLRPLSSILDPDDQMSVISSVKPTSTQLCQPLKTIQNLTPDEEINDWRSSTKSVGDRLNYILENDNKYQDVIFEVQGNTSKEQFKAHKLVVRIASPVFDKMFQESERSNQTTSQIIIPVINVEPSTFKLLLKFIYTDQIDKAAGDSDILSLLQTAKKYNVRQLYVECSRLLKHNMSDQVALKLCGLAASYGDNLLLDDVMNHIASKAFHIFPLEDFAHLEEESVRRLFVRDDLRIDEVTLFEAAMKWGEFNCIQQGIPVSSTNLRKVMENLIPEIRFPLMRPDEFTLLVIPTTLLTPEEQVGIFQYLCVDTTKQNKLPPISFKTTPRRSQKSLDLDSDSSMDYREDSRSPEQQQRSESALNPDCMDLTTTEAESETASNVSVSVSDNMKKSHKYERSQSISSSASTNKRRKLDKEHRPSVEKPSRPIPLHDLFGDFEASTNIKLENVTISLNEFVQELSRNEHRDKIESIEFRNVTIEDSKKLEGRKIYFPRLRSFELNIQIEESISSIITEKSFSVEKYLFFCGKYNKTLLYEDLWSMNLEMTVIVNKVIVFRMSQGDKNHVVLNKFNGAPNVLKSLNEKSVKSLVYSHTHFKDKYFPLSLNRMVILGVVSNQCMSSFVKKFKHLKELTLVSPATTEGNARSLTLDNEFSSKDKIRKLGLGSFKIHLEPTIRFYNVIALSLWRVSWESYFEEKIHHTFPKLQEFTLIGPTKVTAKLLKNLFKISTLREIVSWNCDWRLSDSDNVGPLKETLADAGIADNEKSFVLKKNTEMKSWSGKKIAYTLSQQYIYSKFEYEYLYDDISAFMNTS